MKGLMKDEDVTPPPFSFGSQIRHLPFLFCANMLLSKAAYLLFFVRTLCKFTVFLYCFILVLLHFYDSPSQ